MCIARFIHYLDLENEGRQVVAVVFRFTFRLLLALCSNHVHLDLRPSLQTSFNKNGLWFSINSGKVEVLPRGQPNFAEDDEIG